MKSGRTMAAAFCALLMLPGADAAALEQQGATTVEGDTILRNIEARWASLKDYAVTLEVVADIERMDIPPTVVRMFYKHPDKMHFESEGFAMLPRDALRFNPRGLRERFSVESVARDTADGKYRLKLISRGETTPVRRLTMIVHPKEFTIDGLESGTTDGRRMKAVFTHMTIEGFLLPSTLVVEFSSDAAADPPTPDPTQGPARPRRGKVTITFTDYELNRGLPDDLFMKKDQ